MIVFYIISGCLLFLIMITLFLIFPSAKKHPDTTHLKGLFIAHRGLHKNSEGIPENSLKAFELAVANGFAIENDIHITADGEIVVFHDDNLKRMCGADKIIEDLTLEEIKNFNLLNTGEKIPTLKECLDLIDGRVPLLIEFKCRSIINCKELCTAANKILNNYKGRYFIQSFFPMVLKWYKKHRPDVVRGQLAEDFKGEPIYKKMLGNMLFNVISRPHFISYKHTSKSKIMFKLAKKLGGFPVGWTFTSEKELNFSKNDFNTYIFENFTPYICPKN